MFTPSGMRAWILLMAWMVTGGLMAQSLSPRVLATGGQSVTQGSIQLSYTVGEVATTALSADTLLLTQGFHQPETGTPVSLDNPAPTTTLAIYPNPCSDWLWIRSDSPAGHGPMELYLYNAAGLLAFQTGMVLSPGQAHTLDLRNLPPGSYSLHIREHDQARYPPATLIKVHSR